MSANAASMHTDISAVVLNYRRADLTSACVDSLIGQVAAIAVVDNSGDDEHGEQLIQALARLRTHAGQTLIEHIPAECNLGFAKGIQKGLDHLSRRSRWTAFLIINNDAIAAPGMLKQLVDTLELHAGRAVVAPEACTDGTPSIRWYHRVFALVLTRKQLGAFPYLSGACLLVPAPLTTPFLFDPDFFMYGEDIELSWRLARQGVALVTAPCRFDHIGSASSGLGSPFYEYHLNRGHLMLARKLAGNRINFLALLAGRYLSLPVRALFRSARAISMTPLVALVRAFGTSPAKP
jgi:GT2 family glycosyltransferase